MSDKPRKTKKEVVEETRHAELDMLNNLHTSKNQMADDTEIRYVAVCSRACVFRGQYWPVGREYRGFVKPPNHFEITGEAGLKGASLPGEAGLKGASLPAEASEAGFTAEGGLRGASLPGEAGFYGADTGEDAL